MDDLRRAYRTAVIIGLAMMASLVVYLVIVGLFENGTITLQGPAALAGSRLEHIKIVFLGISAVLFLLVRPITRRVLASDGKQRSVHDAPHRSGSGAQPETVRLTVAAIITFALCEVPAVLGLVLYFLGRNASDFYLFLVISLFSFSMHFPKFSQWEEWYQRR
jgi:F0F1-type ATP synthase membrane subunit c/vacuolar-type H+-ATPase subunit K